MTQQNLFGCPVSTCFSFAFDFGIYNNFINGTRHMLAELGGAFRSKDPIIADFEKLLAQDCHVTTQKNRTRTVFPRFGFPPFDQESMQVPRPLSFAKAFEGLLQVTNSHTWVWSQARSTHGFYSTHSVNSQS